MKKAYDNHSADSLIPLLRVIQREIRERSDAVRILENRLRAFSLDQADSSAFLAVRAELSNHRREIRLSKKELERIGCALDAGQPNRVLIPGRNGELDAGFSWALGDTRVQAIMG
ncbi:MAG: DUF2203 family protein [Planctomycetota bacterium]|jgi:hypothetical protein|nr:DUF2203 family protein [Planctomycetota bacterium]MDP6991013.1 DUF2203 family protein [Planctomycetota bacterium]